MTNQFATIIVPASVAVAVRAIAKTSHAETSNEFVAACSPTGALPATHYISSGLFPVEFFNAIINPGRLYAMEQAYCARLRTPIPPPFSQAQIASALALCDISLDPPFVALARMGLQPANPPRS